MTTYAKTMKLGMVINASGTHIAAWRHPRGQADANVNIAYYRDLARVAERGKLDFLFFADGLSVRETPADALGRTAQYVAQFEPITLLSALAAVTESIGLVATASTSYSEPYNVARTFASLDLVSGGRAGWNIVTSTSEAAARNFGRDAHYGHEERYERATEFTQVVLGLWKSWEDDAFVHDPATGVVLIPEKMHRLDHKGRFFKVEGPLNVPRSPQGHPVLVQAGASPTGRAFAAQFAEVVFTGPMTLSESQTIYADIKAQAEAFGRDPEDVKVLPGFCPVVGRTEAEAQEQYDLLQSLVDPIVAREHLSFTLGGVDLSPYPLDGPLPDLTPTDSTSLSAFKTTMDLARRENLTIAQLAMRLTSARQKIFVIGSAEQIVDQMEEWFTKGAADGFNIMPPILPGSLTDFVELVLPELRRRGLFRTEYEGRTLREHLGLPRPDFRLPAPTSAVARSEA